MESPWKERLTAANRFYERWEQKYRCSKLEEYYRGFHWKSNESDYPQAYVLNMVYATLEIKLASYTFQNLRFHIKPRPSKSDWNLEFAVRSAQLKEDVLNTLVSNPNGRFYDEVEAALRDSFLRFGILEVGYSADWITNPNAGKPLYVSDIDSSSQSDEVLREPDQIPENELVFFKRIPAARFRVGGIEGRYLPESNWFGYYDFYYADDIRASKVLKNTEQLETVSHRTVEWDAQDVPSSEFSDLLKKGDLLKIWKIWDLRAKTCNLYDEANGLVLWEKPFKRIPIFDLRWIKDTLGWYPIPPVFHWISPQDEINESRQQMRSYRRRFTSQQYAIEGQIDVEEIDKYEEGKDGAVIKIKREGAVGPIPNNPLTQVVPEAMVVGKDDMVLVSGTSSEAMGQADRITATQSIEISKRFAVREGREQFKVANWVEKCAREALMLCIEQFTTGLWVKSTQNPGESILGEVQKNQDVWEYILAQNLEDGVDFDIELQITSMSPLDNDAEKQKFIEFLSLLKNFPEIALSPLTIREAAYRTGYRNETVIRELQATSLLASMGQMAQGQMPGKEGARTAQMKTDQMAPTNIADAQAQLDGQLVQ